MAGELIYAFRVMRLPLLDAGGSEIGKIQDIVVVPGRVGHPPRVVGFVASSQRRKIFVNAARIAELDADGARLRGLNRPHLVEHLLENRERRLAGCKPICKRQATPRIRAVA